MAVYYEIIRPVCTREGHFRSKWQLVWIVRRNETFALFLESHLLRYGSPLGHLLLCMPCQGGGAPAIALKRATDSQQLILSTCKVAEDRW